MRRDQALRAEREVTRLAHAGLDWSTLSLRAGEVLRRAVPFDHACWHTVDPTSMLFTGVTKDSLEDELRLPYHEYALADVNQWADLSRRPAPVGILSQSTGGRPHASPRYRHLLAPRGIDAELRAAFVSGGSCWGACGIYRDRGHADFSVDEARLLGRVGRQLADGYRRALMLAALDHGGAVPERAGPGLVLFDAGGTVDAVDATALAYLETVADRLPVPPTGEIPAVVRAVAERTRCGGEPPARARVRTRDGGWLVLYGTRLPGGPAERLAVLVEPARQADLWPLVAEAYQLTCREREIALLCLRGMSTVEMARVLHLSPHTLQDHLKVIFEKVGVRARRALVAKVFMDCYWRPVLAGRAPDHRGGFVVD